MTLAALALWLAAPARADELAFLGFSPSGRFAAWAEVRATADGFVAEVRSLDVPASAWAHWPITARGATAEEASAAARSAAAERLAAERVTADVPGERVAAWRELVDPPDRLPRTTLVRVPTPDGTGVLSVRETVSDAVPCPAGPAVTPALTWTGPDGVPVDLLRLRGPDRVPACALRYDLHEVRRGPEGALVFVFRAWVSTGPDEVTARFVPASVVVRTPPRG